MFPLDSDGSIHEATHFPRTDDLGREYKSGVPKTCHPIAKHMYEMRVRVCIPWDLPHTWNPKSIFLNRLLVPLCQLQNRFGWMRLFFALLFFEPTTSVFMHAVE